MATLQLFILSLLLSLSPPSHVSAVAPPNNPFTAKAAVIRYWNRKNHNHRPLPSFLLSKLSPLSAPAAASASAAFDPSLLPSLCSAAGLLCYADLNDSDSQGESHRSDVNFTSYENPNFSNYVEASSGGLDAFTTYSENGNVAFDSFRRYSRDSASHDDSFTNYDSEVNQDFTNFTSYATGATGGSGSFSTYSRDANVPNLRFTNYEADASAHPRSFTGYSDDSNSGDQSFSGYGKDGDSIATNFASYATETNIIGSGFDGYGKHARLANDSFTSYGYDGNTPQNKFQSYGENGDGAIESFISYRDQANVGDDSFQSYAKLGNADRAGFENYGNSSNPGSDTFNGYGVGSTSRDIGFKTYANENTTFRSYAETGITFAAYLKASSAPPPSGSPVNRWVEPGKFFRERNLIEGSVMPMPDIRDRMPKRSFLPRSIAGKLPFNATALGSIFRAPVGSAMWKAMSDTVAECERAPSRGETKRCATSAEDMIDFAVAVLGSDVAALSTESVRGSGGDILIGNVTGINGGNVTSSVSCHQSLFPYMVYYCHSVPLVRVYVADIHDVGSRVRINRGVAICHLDTSDWSAGHGAFVALGSKPGEIEVCHWIFEGDMTWTVAD